MQRTFTLFFVIIFTYTSALAQGEQASIDKYVHTYAPIAVSEMLRSGIPASITLAQGLLESSMGNSQLATEGNNHFGIKCHDEWHGKTMSYDDDQKGECFRKYSSAEESYRDHTDFLLKRGRYVDLFCLDKTDYQAWAAGLKKDGYATDPAYAGRLIHLIESNDLEQFDTVVNYDIFIAKFEGDKPEIYEQNGTEPDNMYASQDVFYFNNIKTITARPGDVPLQVALHFDISLNRLYKYNDMYEGDLFNAGEKVYLQPKRSKGDVDYHIVKEGETMRSISQDHGMRLAKLYERNKLSPGEQPTIGEKLYLKKTRENAPEIAQPEVSPVVKSSSELPQNDNMAGAVATIEKGDPSTGNNPANDKNEVLNFDQNPEPTFMYYQVKTGDTLYSISRSQGVTVQQLKQLNSLAADKISIGQLIKVPAE